MEKRQAFPTLLTMSLNRCIRMGQFSTMHIPSCLRTRLRDSYSAIRSRSRSRSLSYDSPRPAAMFCMPTLKYLAPPKIAVSALLARRRWGTPVVLSPHSTEDRSLCLFRCALLTTLRPDNVLPSLTGRVFSLHANFFDQQRSHMNVSPNSKCKCTWKCTWEHACALWCFSNKSKNIPHSNCMHSDISLDHVVS